MSSSHLLRQLPRLGAVALVYLSSATPLLAQQRDSLPFRARQWGAEFSVDNFAGVGALLFTSPATAWLVDVRARLTRYDRDDDAVPQSYQDRDSNEFQTRLGWRRYGVLAPRVVRHVGGGLLASRSSSTNTLRAGSATFPGIPRVDQVYTAVGAYAELGAQWMITRNLSLGASWSASALADRTTSDTLSVTPSGSTRSQGRASRWTASLGTLAIRAGLYF